MHRKQNAPWVTSNPRGAHGPHCSHGAHVSCSRQGTAGVEPRQDVLARCAGPFAVRAASRSLTVRDHNDRRVDRDRSILPGRCGK